MTEALSNIRIQINEKLYLKDPESSQLGSLIVSEGIQLINLIGFEQFTFKKLAKRINSTESSVYRYFENKHKFLLYITSLYWSYMEYRLVIATNSIKDKYDKLMKAIEIVTSTPDNSFFNTSVDQIALREIVISEFTKAYHNKSVDEENKQGFFKVYKRLVFRLTDMIEDLDSSYLHTKSLASLLLDGALHQHFLAMHFQSITNCSTAQKTGDFFKNLVSNQINYTPNEFTK
ncbi:TetR/AcrR family transcriptional regulator [Psychroflexus salis]|uniref:TetR family transcriptional regulator n=1 Tax=Psychroflexus salis TaxID=1526574 RepID=A0A916ZXS2_9FLAO|nr:TetR/AcrR family transcriptional regulator [Psychroflexus salis]GGE18307.1 TetR family transcriptional regulator [Psychroflexus salis]